MTEKERNIIVSAKGLSKEFKDFWHRPKAKAVNNIDFDVFEGEVVGLLGPNGSGKSTTVKMLLGLLYPTGGMLRVFDQSPRDVITKKYIGYLPEETYLYKYLNAVETLDFFGALFNLPVGERKNRSKQLLEMVGLSHAARRPVGEFSKGMQRRIGLAQAMINDPDLLILDEPTSGLDPIGCREIKDLIKLLKQRGKTVLITSHLLSDVEDICDRVIILYGGKVRATGTLNELLTEPDTSVIKTPSLNAEMTRKVVAILREQLKGETFEITNPRKSLEAFFLEVVSQAKEEIVDTSGVTSGGEIAEYLQKDKEKVSVLKELTEDAEDSAGTPPAVAEAAEKDSEIEGVTEKIQELVSDEVTKAEDEKQEAATEAAMSSQKGNEELNEVDKKLADLLGDKE